MMLLLIKSKESESIIFEDKKNITNKIKKNITNKKKI